MKQKILAAALALVLLFALLPAAVWAEELPPAGAASTTQQQEQSAPSEAPAEELPPQSQAPAAGAPAQPQQASQRDPQQSPQQDPPQNEPSPPQNAPAGDPVEPLLKFMGNVLYTKGAPVTITANGNGINVTYMRTAEQPETITYPGQDAVIFGGGADEEHFHQASITLNSGTVSTIYGGGHGEDYSADVNEATIIVNGGTVTNCVYGGGLNRSVVQIASITVNDGTIAKYALGGGAMESKFGANNDQKPDFASALNGTAVNRTLKASVVVNGGTVNYPMGGGHNYSYVGETRVELNGGSCSELVAGGSNGYTAKSTVTVSGGSVTGYLHTVNRGAVGEVVLNLNGGSITDLYYGWNKNDQEDEHGTLKSGAIPLNQGGGVRTALTVYYKGATVSGSINKTSGIQANAKVVEVITNTATPDTAAPDAPNTEKQAKVDEAVKKAVTDASAPAKSGSTIITSTLQNNQVASALLQNPAMTDPEEGFAKMVQGMQGVGDADATLVLSKNISVVSTNSEGKVTLLVFDVAPIKVSGESVERLQSLPSALFFRLPLPADWPTPYATVRHIHGDQVTTTEVPVKTTEGGSKYIEVTRSVFSPFEISPLKALTPAPQPDQGSNGGGEATPAKTVVVSLLDATPKTGASWAMPALLLAACGFAALGALSLRRKKQ